VLDEILPDLDDQRPCQISHRGKSLPRAVALHLRRVPLETGNDSRSSEHHNCNEADREDASPFGFFFGLLGDLAAVACGEIGLGRRYRLSPIGAPRCQRLGIC